MGLFGLLNYEDYIFKLIVKSQSARNGLVVAIIWTITSIIKFHISIVIYMLFSFGITNPVTALETIKFVFDLIFPIIVTVSLSLTSDILYRYIEMHRHIYENWADYLIDNYNRDNFMKWKRILLIILSVYTLIAICLVSINNGFIFITTMQTAISFGICDLIEHKIFNIMYKKLINRIYVPKVRKFYEDPSTMPTFKSEIKNVDNEINHLTGNIPIIKDYLPNQNKIHSKISENNTCIDSNKSDEIQNDPITAIEHQKCIKSQIPIIEDYERYK